MQKLIFPIAFLLVVSACNLFQKAEDVKLTEPAKPERKLRALTSFSKDTIVLEQTLEQTSKIITALASDEFEGRATGHKGFDLAAQYVEDFLASHGIQPFFENGYGDTLKAHGKKTYNVVGLIGERNDDAPYILLGAHLDHLGKKRSRQDSVYNGANDNASGVTAVMQVAAQLAKYDFEQSIIVALFSAEEMGLIGSQHLAKKLKKEGIKLSYVINFEMIGKTLTAGANKVYLTGYNRSNFAQAMNEAAGSNFVVFLPAEVRHQLFSRSDNFPFYAEFKVPSHTLSTFDFENYNFYHRTADEVEQLDLENMHQVINTATYAIGEMLKSKVLPEMKKD